jgi:RecG-like helicase
MPYNNSMVSFFKRNKTTDGQAIHDNKVISLLVAKNKFQADDISKVKNRTHVVVVGNVVSTRIVPKAKSFWFEVIIDDGTGKVDGWFFGRKEIKGLELGSLVLMKGLVQMDEGEMTIANPFYQLL